MTFKLVLFQRSNQFATLSKCFVMTALAISLAQFQVRAVHANDEAQVALLRNSPEVLALNHEPLPFTYRPSSATLYKECEKATAGDAPTTAPNNVGLIPFLLGALFSEIANDRREQAREQARVECARRQRDHDLELSEEAKRISASYSLQAPTARVKARVIADLAQLEGLRNVRTVDVPLPSTAVSILNLKEKFGVFPVIEFSPLAWGIDQRQAGLWDIFVQQSVVVINVQDNRLLSVQTCRQPAQADATLEGLLENEGALLKAKLIEAADACAEQMIDGFTGKRRDNLNPTPKSYLPSPEILAICEASMAGG